MDSGRVDYPFVSVIIVNKNGEKWLRKCVPSVVNSDYPKNKIEVIIVDNGSTDNSIKYVEEIAKNETISIRIIKNKENKGWSPANNQGAKVSSGEILIFLSNDLEVDKSWIKEIVQCYLADTKIGIVQCNSVSMWDRMTPDSGMNYLDKFGFAYGYTSREDPCEVFFAEGMAFAIRREVFEQIDGFDDYYFMEYDDMDLCWRARLVGYKVVFTPRSVVYHARGGTVGKAYFERVKNVEWYTRNHITTLIKNYELRNLVRILPVVLTMEIIKILYLLIVKRSGNVAYAAVKGILQVVKNIRIIFLKRQEVKKIRKVTDKIIMKYMHPFNPRLQYLFIIAQAKGRRFILNSESSKLD